MIRSAVDARHAGVGLVQRHNGIILLGNPRFVATSDVFGNIFDIAGLFQIAKGLWGLLLVQGVLNNDLVECPKVPPKVIFASPIDTLAIVRYHDRQQDQDDADHDDHLDHRETAGVRFEPDYHLPATSLCTSSRREPCRPIWCTRRTRSGHPTTRKWDRPSRNACPTLLFQS